MNHSSKPGLSFNTGSDALHGVLRVDQIRNETLVQLVQHWSEPKDRDAIIDALDELAGVVCGVAREGELDAALEQVEDAACMDSAQVQVHMHDVRRLLAELKEVEHRTSRFAKGASDIKHPAMLPTRRHFEANPLPEQTDRRWTA
ncbi:MULTISPECIES: hypothetical protein [unclassified Streptomyces]|uniref:hypothetical protein n=2 Tax=Streptomyces TaxID=1883 RepID=UPI000851F9B6|nr:MULTISPECIES: hypothetical protein [unclassified Streptomyces]